MRPLPEFLALCSMSPEARDALLPVFAFHKISGNGD